MESATMHLGADFSACKKLKHFTCLVGKLGQNQIYLPKEVFTCTYMDIILS